MHALKLSAPSILHLNSTFDVQEFAQFRGRLLGGGRESPLKLDLQVGKELRDAAPLPPAAVIGFFPVGDREANNNNEDDDDEEAWSEFVQAAQSLNPNLRVVFGAVRDSEVVRTFQQQQ